MLSARALRQQASEAVHLNRQYSSMRRNGYKPFLRIFLRHKPHLVSIASSVFVLHRVGSADLAARPAIAGPLIRPYGDVFAL